MVKYLEFFAFDWKNTHIFCLSLPLTKGCRNGAARLCDPEPPVIIVGWCEFPLMLVTPKHKVKKIGQKLLRNIIGGAMLSMILVKNKQIKPGFHVFSGSDPIHIPFDYKVVQAFIPNGS